MFNCVKLFHIRSIKKFFPPFFAIKSTICGTLGKGPVDAKMYVPYLQLGVHKKIYREYTCLSVTVNLKIYFSGCVPIFQTSYKKFIGMIKEAL